MTPFSLPVRALLQDDARPGGASRLFRDPLAWIEARDEPSADAALARLDRAVANGFWVAGAFAFELGYLLEPRLRRHFRPSPDPLIAAGIYRAPEAMDGRQAFLDLAAGRAAVIAEAQPALDVAAYIAAFDRVRAYIEAGDVYQVNLTFPLALALTGDPFARLAAWRARARAGHAAVLRLDDRDVFSFSPELFLASDGDGVVRARPMKGTLARGPDTAGDAAARAALAADPKQRAENLMIVDLLRNDLSRVCEPGSVRVTDLFTVETYPTLHTMTTGVEGRLRSGLAPGDILRALFPCGSVTGAPKIRAMEIIAETEPAPRGFYCGAIGAFGPDGRVDLNVAIRTLVNVHDRRALRMGVGGGLVFDSQPGAEYGEALLKAHFATRDDAPFALLETLRWEQGIGFYFLDDHLARLADAAAYFVIPYDDRAIRAALDAYVTQRTGMRRVRLLLGDDGLPAVQSTMLDSPFSGAPNPLAPPLPVAIVATRLASCDPFMRHKTTHRAIYDEALTEAKSLGAAEALLLNEHGRLADGSFTTMFALRDGALHTPPPCDGALPGVLKAVLARRAAPPVVETALTPSDLRSADALFIGNSVRGLLPARLV